MIIASIYPCPFDVQDRHDLSAALIKDGEIFAYEEGKLTSIKNESTVKFPERSLMMGCKELDVLPSEIDKWVFPVPKNPVDYKEQYLFFSWIFKAYKGEWKNFSDWYRNHIYFVPHQNSHTALAVLASDFEECAFLNQDGGGDFGDERDLIFGEYSNGKFHTIKQHYGQNTIASFHAFVTDALSFSGGNNGKTSGLASYGKVQDKLAKAYFNLISVGEDGIIFKRERYKNTEVNLKKIHPTEYDRGKILYHYPSDTNILRLSIDYLPQDVAATAEYVLRVSVLKLIKKLKKMTNMENIVFSGGLFQNVALNNAILESGLFKKIFIPMSPDDGGLSLGQALYIENQFTKRERKETLTPLLGPSFRNGEIENLLNRFRLIYSKEDDISKTAAKLITKGKIVGWFQGRGEYGPRALGNRSILADPRKLSSKSRVNQFLKRRDWFMPYAPSILEEYIHDWVVIPHESPYMQIAFKILDDKEKLIPSAVHVDGSSRVHVVRKNTNEKYWHLIDYFREMTGLPIILNTSFNRHGISTISTPRQAIEHFLEGCMDYLAIEDYLIDFTKNRIVSEQDYIEKKEDVLLKEDCIKRLNDVFKHGNKSQINQYIVRLSEFVGKSIQYDNEEIIIEDDGNYNLDEAINELLKYVNNK